MRPPGVDAPRPIRRSPTSECARHASASRAKRRADASTPSCAQRSSSAPRAALERTDLEGARRALKLAREATPGGQEPGARWVDLDIQVRDRRAVHLADQISPDLPLERARARWSEVLEVVASEAQRQELERRALEAMLPSIRTRLEEGTSLEALRVLGMFPIAGESHSRLSQLELLVALERAEALAEGYRLEEVESWRAIIDFQMSEVSSEAQRRRIRNTSERLERGLRRAHPVSSLESGEQAILIYPPTVSNQDIAQHRFDQGAKGTRLGLIMRVEKNVGGKFLVQTQLGRAFVESSPNVDLSSRGRIRALVRITGQMKYRAQSGTQRIPRLQIIWAY